jgi:hypothetical protein
MQKKWRLVLAVLGLSLALTSSAFAQNPNRPGAALRGMGQGMGLRLQRLLGAEKLQSIQSLNLTDDQKASIKSMLAGQKTQILQAASKVVKARIDMINKVQGADGELATALSNARNLKIIVWDQIKSVLTSDQLAKAQEKQQLRAQRLQKLLDRINSKIGG